MGLGNAGLVGVLKRLGRFGRHVVFVMLGKHFGRREKALGVELALTDHALPFGEEVGQNAAVLHRHGLGRIGDRKLHGHAVAETLDAARLDNAAEAEGTALRGFVSCHLRRREEKDEVFIEGLKRQRNAGADHHDGGADQGQFFGLRIHDLHLQGRLGGTRLAGETGADFCAAGAQRKDFINDAGKKGAVGTPHVVAVAVHVDEFGKRRPVHSLPSSAAF